MRNVLNIAVFIIISISLTSCFDKESPNYRYMPNMYAPVGLETNGEYDILPNQQVAMLPVEGTITRGWLPYEYENTIEGKALAIKELNNPLEVTDKNLEEGKKLFTIYCAVCHGNKGDGQGILVKREKFLGIPSYADKGRIINDGSIYHVMMYGLNSMGSHASQTNEKERWQITMHVQDLKSALNGEPLWSETQKRTNTSSEEMEETTSNEENSSQE
jgi:mono/diheme cytochrome c family protein